MDIHLFFNIFVNLFTYTKFTDWNKSNIGKLQNWGITLTDLSIVGIDLICTLGHKIENFANLFVQFLNQQLMKSILSLLPLLCLHCHRHFLLWQLCVSWHSTSSPASYGASGGSDYKPAVGKAASNKRDWFPIFCHNYHNGKWNLLLCACYFW